ncbi:MAG: hypothetical protein IK083_04380 [Abditibacteriota bacterium]|nr:hypothetical protein [Abditibacteriota bacterium]
MRALLLLCVLLWAAPLWAEPEAVKQRWPGEDRAICEYVLQADVSGRTDATAALQGLIDRAAEAGGGVIWCPAGTYRFEGSLRLRKGVTLRGDRPSPRKTGGRVQGTVFAIYAGRGSEEGPAFVTMEKVSGLTDLSLWYPEQDPEHITPYPWTVAATDRGSCGYTVRRVTFVNSYKALSNGADDGEGYNVAFYSDLCGCPLKYGLWINLCLDITRFEYLSFGPRYWEQSGLPGAPATGRAKKALRQYLYDNGEAFVSGLFDWLPIYEADIEGYGVGLHFVQNGFGCPNGQLCRVRVRGGRVGLLADNVAIYGWCITDCEFTSLDRPGAAGVRLSAGCGRGPFMFHSCRLGRVEAEEGCLAAVSMMNCSLTGDVTLASGDSAVINCSQKAGRSVAFAPGRDNLAASPGLRYTGEARAGKADRTDAVSASYKRPPLFRPRSSRVFSVRAFGAKGDGKTDDTRAFAAALEAAGKAGGTAYVPAGRYLITAPLTVPSGAELRGIGEGPPHTMVPASCILAGTAPGSEEGALVSLEEGSSLRGVGFWYPRARFDRATPFPWTVRALGKNCQVRDVSLGNSWQGLDFASAGDVSGHLISGVVGCCRRRGVFVDHAPRGGVVENCHLAVHYWDRNDGDLPFEGPRLLGDMHDVNNAMRRESESYVFGKCSREYIRSTFSVFSRRGLTLKEGFRGVVINHGSDGTVSGINAEGDSRSLLINTLSAPVPTVQGKTEYRPLDPDNPLYVNRESRSIACGPDFEGSARCVNTAVWGFGDAIRAEGPGRLTLELFNSLLGLSLLREARVYGAYSQAGALWAAAGRQGDAAFFGSWGFLEETGLTDCAREARVTASSRYVEGQGTAELTDGFPLKFYASEQEEGTWIRFDFDRPRAIEYAVLINAAPDGDGYLTRAAELYGVDPEGREVPIGGWRDNTRCVAVTPLGGEWQSIVLRIREPNSYDRHTRIGDVYLLTRERPDLPQAR